MQVRPVLTLMSQPRPLSCGAWEARMTAVGCSRARFLQGPVAVVAGGERAAGEAQVGAVVGVARAAVARADVATGATRLRLRCRLSGRRRPAAELC